MLDENELEEADLREKINIYFKNRTAAPSEQTKTDIDEDSNDEANYNNEKARRSAAQIRVRDTTKRLRKASSYLAG